MNKKITLLAILLLISSGVANAELDDYEMSQYTGDSFFIPASNELMRQDMEAAGTAEKTHKHVHTTPPIKQLRLWTQDKLKERAERKNQLAPESDGTYQGEVETSEFASKEIEENFEDMTPDGFEADEYAVNDKAKRSLFKKKHKSDSVEQTDDIVLDCDRVDYDTQNYTIYAKGNVSVDFVKQGATLKAETITFDRINNTIKAEGDVRILKSGRTITGDYIFVDLNEENALIENPQTITKDIVMKARKGYVYGDKIVQENGSVVVDGTYPIEFESAHRGPHLQYMMVPKNQNLSTDMENGIIKFTAKDIKITQKGDLETIAIKKGRLYKGSKTIFKIPAVKIYTNKNHDYVESNIWEVGSIRGLGIYTGPGFVFELPKGSVLKAMPILNYKSGIGIGGLGRFSSGTNQTYLSYGTAKSKVVGYGRQELDDNLYLHYAINGYMDEWFMGRRRPKYGAALVYDRGYGASDFLLKGQVSSFQHRLEAGYFQDLDFDRKFERINDGGHIGTTRFRYMAMANQSFINYRNEDKLTAFMLGGSAQLSASVYGTGHTQTIGRIGPYVRTQYKRWMQDFLYYFSAYDDNTPMPAFDSYRYGKQVMSLREYFRICRWLTVSWFGSINVSNDSITGKRFVENSFYLSIGPDDVKMNVGYDFVRQHLYCTFLVMMDAKGAKVEYDNLELRQEKKAKRAPERKADNAYQAPTSAKVLQKAVVEDMKVMEEVL